MGTDPGDDGAVWLLDEGRALVATVDVITPLVDDARAWGRIAAANAASDVYAMGGRPLFALNVVGWNRDQLPLELLGEVLEGAAEMAAEGGWVTAGGHTIDDPEPKFGQAVIGEVDPGQLLRHDRLRAGQHLVLTKPLGIGVATTALKAGQASAALVEAAVASMTRLNAEAMQVALAAGASAATDVTGFGLLGHARRMIEQAALDLEFEASAVPLLPEVSSLASEGLVPGGTRRNLGWVEERMDVDGADELALTLLADAQTSGGLLFGAEPEAAARAVTDLRATGHEAAVVGRTRAGHGRLRVRQ